MVSSHGAAVEFETRVDAALQTTCELARALIGAFGQIGSV
jgi:hypothetical protein